MTRLLRIFALVLVMSLAATLWAASDYSMPATSATGNTNYHSMPNRDRAGHHLDELLLVETWENGFPHGWETVDLTATSATWNLSSYRAFGGTGTSWWVGDSSVGPYGGYGDDWYMTLQTPYMNLPAGTPMMRFWHRYYVEDYTTASAPYDAWDGMNLRIKREADTVWTIIPTTALTPGYTRTSLFSFGDRHCEGPNIPGWCAIDSAWHLQIVNLSAWAGQRVAIRFAFASDGGWSTVPDDSLAFGWMIDRIRCFAGTDTFFSDDCNSSAGWVSGTGRNPGGDLWRVVQDTDPSNGSMVLVCNNPSTNEYNVSMHCAIMSPYIDLRGIGFGTVYVDMKVKGVTWCPDTEDDANCDRWGCQISIDSGRTWCHMTNPTCNSTDTSWSYVGEWGDNGWDWASNGMGTHPWPDFYQFHNNVIRIRLFQQSGCDPNVAQGMGFDSVIVRYNVGYHNDVTCSSLQIRYPVIANRPIRIKGYFSNPGQNDQNDIGCWYRYIPGGTTWRALGLPFNLLHSQSATRDTVMVISTPGLYQFQARSSLASDQNPDNDTTNVYDVNVLPAGSTMEIGYDNHSLGDIVHYYPELNVGQGPLVRFSVVTDNVVSRFNLQSVKMQFLPGQTANDMPVRLHILSDRFGSPFLDIYTANITVGINETGTLIWKTVDVSSDPDTRNMNGDFWVWLENVNGGETPHWPCLIADASHGWTDIHHYLWSGAGSILTQTDTYFQLRVMLDDLTSADDNPAELPAAWSLEQNHPNPFNPSTEIRFSVPRTEYMTLKVFNLLGQEVATLVNQRMDAGTHRVTFNGANLPSGVYMYRLESASFTAVHKMLLMK